MAELRHNPVTGRWIAVAPSRSARPMDEGGRGERFGSVPSRDPQCPFCPGNEAELPEVLWELDADREPGWRCRAVPNRYPAFETASHDGSSGRATEVRGGEESGRSVLGRRRPARGVQEVLIESPRHDRPPSRMSDEELLDVARLYRSRLRAVERRRPAFAPVVFHNEGREAGASLIHPHGQLIATELDGPERRGRERRSERYRDETGRCLLCDLPEREPDAEARLIEEDAFHRAYVPWAPEQAYETWILPRCHRASFSDVVDEELTSWSALLGRTLRRLHALLGPHPYQYILHTAAGARRDDPALHWFARLRPITGRRAGFEVASGIAINPASPEEVAERLRTTDPHRMEGGEG